MNFTKTFLFLCFIVFFIWLSTSVFSKEVIPFGFCPKYDLPRMNQLDQPVIDELDEHTPSQFDLTLLHLMEKEKGRK